MKVFGCAVGDIASVGNISKDILGSYVIENYYYGSPNEEAIEMADPDVVEMLGLTVPETKLEKGVLYSYNMPDSATWDEYFDAWMAAKAAAAV